MGTTQFFERTAREGTTVVLQLERGNVFRPPVVRDVLMELSDAD